jgi:Ca2+-binding EF-hand superfamily protein
VPNAAPVVERGTGDPKQVMAANDQNGDGRVTKQEADAANKSLSQMWDAYDTNKDGIVDAEEVAQVNATYFAVAKTQARKTGPDAIIMANDKDGDGIVTRAEAQQVNRSLIANWSMYDLNKDGRTDRYEIARALAE